MAQWILVTIAIAGLIYNTIVTHVIMKNDLKHLKEDVAENKDYLKELLFHLLGGKK